MQNPSRQQELYCHLIQIYQLLTVTKERIYLSELDDLRLLSDVDKCRLYLSQAIDRIQTLEEKGSKNVCY